MEEDALRTSLVQEISTSADPPQTSTALALITGPLITDDPESQFIHPKETLEAIDSRVKAVKERFTRSDDSSPEFEYVLPVESNLSDLEHLVPTLEPIKETKYGDYGSFTSFENFRTKILEHVETLQPDFLTLHRYFLHFKANLMDSHATVVVN